MKTIRSRPVMPACCASCPFREGGDARLAANVLSRTVLQAQQICHHPRIHGKRSTHFCRGARDVQLTILYRLGLLPEPTDAAFDQTSREILGEEKIKIMALKALGLDKVLALKPQQRTAYFEQYAGYFPSSPQQPYAIRVGSKTLFSDDTMDLRIQFDKYLRSRKRAAQRITLERRILVALATFPRGRAPYHQLMHLVWPPADHPRAYRGSVNGGPPGVAMAFGRALGQMYRGRLIDRPAIYLAGHPERFGQPDVQLAPMGRKRLGVGSGS